MNDDLFCVDLPENIDEVRENKRESIRIDNRSMVNFKHSNSMLAIIAICLSSLVMAFVLFIIYKQVNATLDSKTLIDTVAK